VAKFENKSLEFWTWDAAGIIRGAKNVPKYINIILSLIFTKDPGVLLEDEINRFTTTSAAE